MAKSLQFWWQVAPKPNTFMPFGNGIHSCPGNELAKLEILILVHHLTTKYRWCIIGPQNGIQYGPFALPQNGLPIRISRKSPPRTWFGQRKMPLKILKGKGEVVHKWVSIDSYTYKIIALLIFPNINRIYIMWNRYSLVFSPFFRYLMFI